MHTSFTTTLTAFQNVITIFLRIGMLAIVVVLAFADTIIAQEASKASAPAAAAGTPQAPRGEQQAERDAAFAKMMSGATLEGSFTNTSAGRDSTKLSREKYTLGDVKKLGGNIWLIPARIEYGDHDVTLPIPVPIEWAGDTPVIVVDNVALPGFGTVSARVMFFADHYAGYWKHGQSGGHLFGVIRNGEKPAETDSGPEAKPASSSGDVPTGQQRDE